MLRPLVFIFVIPIVLRGSDSAKIFAWFPTPSISHQVVFRPLTQELARRGHQVTVMTTDPVFPKGQAPANLTEIDVHDISYNIWREVFMENQEEMGDNLEAQMIRIYKAVTAVLDKQLNTTEIKNIIKGHEHYDLLLLEGIAVGSLALTHVTKAPVVLVSSFGAISNHLETFGAPVHPFLYPLNIRKRIFNLTLWEKLNELHIMWRMKQLDVSFGPTLQNMLVKHFGEDLPPIKEFERNVDVLLMNENPVWSGNRPVPPNMVFIGGIHQNPRKVLPEHLDRYLNSSKHGVIYMSFGTNVDPTVLPPEKIQAFVKAFSELPYDVLWKWNGDELPGRTENIRISKWLPQSDLLYHPKIKLFITQGGLQSTDEAINAGVPLIGVPLIADQWYNVEHYVHHKVGLQLDINTIDAETMKNAVKTVIGDPSYRANMMKIRDLMRDEPMPALERAVWWTEHVLRHGGARHLRAPAANMPWARYYELDLILVMLGIVVVPLLVGIIIILFFVRLLKKSLTKAKVKES